MKRIRIVRKYEEGIKAGSEMYRLGQEMKTMFGYDFMDMPRLNPDLKEFIGGSFGAMGRLYEMDGGVVLCYDHVHQGGCVWDVMLLGFNEDNEVYKKFKVKLENIASGNPDRVEKVMKDEPINFSKRMDKWVKEELKKRA